MKCEPMKKSHHHGHLREAVIALAMDEARQGSIEAISMRDVSRRLGVSPAAVYRHFTDREAILHAVAEAGFDLLAQRFEAVMPYASVASDGSEALERFEALAVEYVAFARGHFGLWRLMFGPYGLGPKPERDARPSTYDWLGKSLAELLAAGRIESATSQDQYFIWTAIHGFSDLCSSSAPLMAVSDTDARDQARRALRSLGFRDRS